MKSKELRTHRASSRNRRPINTKDVILCIFVHFQGGNSLAHAELGDIVGSTTM